MAIKTIHCTVSSDLVATRPDSLSSECFRVEALSKLIMHPGVQARVNLAIHNSSTDGRMAQVIANYDPRQYMVTIPTAAIYVAGGSKTVIFAMITPLLTSGQAPITFEAF